MLSFFILCQLDMNCQGTSRLIEVDSSHRRRMKRWQEHMKLPTTVTMASVADILELSVLFIFRITHTHKVGERKGKKTQAFKIINVECWLCEWSILEKGGEMEKEREIESDADVRDRGVVNVIFDDNMRQINNKKKQ